MIFVQVGVFLFVSNIGSEYFIGLVGFGVVVGIGVGVFEFNVIKYDISIKLIKKLLVFIYVGSRQ